MVMVPSGPTREIVTTPTGVAAPRPTPVRIALEPGKVDRAQAAPNQERATNSGNSRGGTTRQIRGFNREASATYSIIASRLPLIAGGRPHGLGLVAFLFLGAQEG